MIERTDSFEAVPKNSQRWSWGYVRGLFQRRLPATTYSLAHLNAQVIFGCFQRHW